MEFKYHGDAQLLRWSLALTLLFASATVSQAEPKDKSDAVRELNTEVVKLFGQVKKAKKAEAANIRAMGNAAIKSRASALNELFEDNPKEAMSLAFSKDLLADIALAFPDSASELEEHGSWQGPAEYFVIDAADLKSSQAKIRIGAGGAKLNVSFTGALPRGLKCGSVLKVDGVRMQTSIAAMGGTVNNTSLSAAGSICSTTGPQKVAALLVTFPGAPVPNLTKQGVYDVLFSPSGRSLDKYWREASYGRTSASGDVFGWFTLDRTYQCGDVMSIMGAAINAADAQVDWTQYGRVLIIYDTTGCSWAGLGSVGCMGLTSLARGPFTSSVAWLSTQFMAPRDYGVTLVSHEAGHNLGMDHASSRTFGTEALGPIAETGTLVEYGDLWSVMGSWTFGHYAAPHKSLIGWLDPATGVQTVETTGTYNLLPYGSTGGLRALKIRRTPGSDAWLWLEYRQPFGDYESTLSPQPFNGAIVHYEDGTTGIKTHVLNMNPSVPSWQAATLAVGTTWTDAYTGLKISLPSASPSGLMVQVTYGGSGNTSCLLANPNLAVSPLNPTVTSGASIPYTATVTNTDSASCSPRTFAMAASIPAGWSSTFAPAALTLAPGQSAAVTLTESVPAGTMPGTYPVVISASAGTSFQSVAANGTVVDPAPVCTSASPTIIISPASLSAAAGSSLNYTVAITNNDSAACSPAAISVSSAAPTGWNSAVSPNVVSVSPGSTGTATLMAVSPTTAPSGPNTLIVSATKGTSTVTAASTYTVLAPPSPSCVRRAATVLMSPATLSASAGASLTYTISLTNNDSAECSTGVFNATSSSPAGWASSISPASLSLAPGQSGSVTLVKTVPTTAVGGNYLVNGNITHDVYYSTATANCSVMMQPPPPTTVTITGSTSATSYRSNSWAYVGAAVTSDHQAVAGAKVTFTVTQPNGSIVSASVVSDSGGLAYWSLKVKQRGTYSVVATTTIGGQVAKSTPLTFVAY
jgi:M6 family metalloprotease-like protein